jgi:hypothetical protein
LLSDSWLVGTSGGVYAANDRGDCERLGAYRFRVMGLDVGRSRVLAATSGGLWEVRQDFWLQLHDETLTEVMDVLDEGESIVAASAYGVAIGRIDAAGAPCWDWLSNDLHVNQRFTNAVLRLDETRLLAGTEGGVLIHQTDGGWLTTTLQMPVRCLLRYQDGYLAGTDEGLWSSADAHDWQPAGMSATVYALATDQAAIIAGTEQGVLVSADGSQWRAAGLAGMRVAALALRADTPGHWYAGGVPGGLWITRNHGQHWVAVPEIRIEVESITAPGGRQ